MTSTTPESPRPLFDFGIIRARPVDCRNRVIAARKRLVDVAARATRTEAAEQAAGGVTIEGNEWVRVTFAEKPDRPVLEALRAAGFRWGGGSWTGPRTGLPQAVADMEQP